MFTGIVQKKLKIIDLQPQSRCVWRLTLPWDTVFNGIRRGSSVAINGVCLTAVQYDQQHIYFDVIAETYRISNLGGLCTGAWVNIERAATFADEIGGHMVSGHVDTTVHIAKIEKPDPTQWILYLKTDATWIHYLFAKGFVCLDGASLTVVDVDLATQIFTVHLIPESISRTRFAHNVVGDQINLEIDQVIKATVDTLNRRYMQI